MRVIVQAGVHVLRRHDAHEAKSRQDGTGNLGVMQRLSDTSEELLRVLPYSVAFRVACHDYQVCDCWMSQSRLLSWAVRPFSPNPAVIRSGKKCTTAAIGLGTFARTFARRAGLNSPVTA